MIGIYLKLAPGAGLVPKLIVKVHIMLENTSSLCVIP